MTTEWSPLSVSINHTASKTSRAATGGQLANAATPHARWDKAALFKATSAFQKNLGNPGRKLLKFSKIKLHARINCAVFICALQIKALESKAQGLHSLRIADLI